MVEGSRVPLNWQEQPKRLQILKQVSKIMVFSRRQLSIISSYFFLILIPYSASLTFNLTKLSPLNQNRDIITEGDGAYISDGGIQVTPDQIGTNQSPKAGRAAYISPLHLWDNASRELVDFTTDFSFVIDSNSATDYAYGLTFFLAENNSVITAGGPMGLPINAENNSAITNPFVAVEFDTYYNSAWDPVDLSFNSLGNHVGIDVNSLFSDTDQKWENNVTGGEECHAWIKYDSISYNFSVVVTGIENGIVVPQIGLHRIIDLRDLLPEWVIFGFSASTGSLFQKNNVKTWSFNSSNLKIDDNVLPPTIGPNPTKGKNRKRFVVGLIVVVCAIVTFLAMGALWVWRNKKKTRGEEVEELEPDTEMNNQFEMSTGLKRFSYQEIARATSKFAEKEKLGEGSFGGVYKGFLKDSSTYVAVKRVSKSSKQGIKEYASEVKIISQLSHRNLVQLIGWCREKELILVYEFMENGSLDSHLFNAKSLLTWNTRYDIAHGLAHALLYLHEECEKCILHRDIKSSNVMLDSNFNAKLGDFGLAKLVDHEKGSQTTMLAGTMGYMAPEYVMTGKASKESDVYSFGIVALEMASGRKIIESNAAENQTNLLEWVWELYGTSTHLEAVDKLLGSDFKEHEIKCLIVVGLWCANPNLDERPSMRQVIQVLKFDDSLPTLPLKMPVATYSMLSSEGATSNPQS